MNRSPIKGDVLIIGAGIIGLGIAVALQECRPNTMIMIAEKEDGVCLLCNPSQFQLSHYSGTCISSQDAMSPPKRSKGL